MGLVNCRIFCVWWRVGGFMWFIVMRLCFWIFVLIWLVMVCLRLFWCSILVGCIVVLWVRFIVWLCCFGCCWSKGCLIWLVGRLCSLMVRGLRNCWFLIGVLFMFMVWVMLKVLCCCKFWFIGVGVMWMWFVSIWCCCLKEFVFYSLRNWLVEFFCLIMFCICWLGNCRRLKFICKCFCVLSVSGCKIMFLIFVRILVWWVWMIGCSV